MPMLAVHGKFEPLTSRLRGPAGPMAMADQPAILPRKPTAERKFEEQIGKPELLTALLTNCLQADSQKVELFNYFKMVGEVDRSLAWTFKYLARRW